MFSLMNSKNKATKKDLCLAYAQGNHSAYPTNMEKMARFLLLQYTRISTPIMILVTKKGIRAKRWVMKPNQKIRVITTQVL